MPEKKFYVLGLSPNGGRISVRFFYENTFGNMLKHVNEHNERLMIAGRSKKPISLRNLLSQTVNPNANDKTPSPVMTGEVMRAIFEGTRYPMSLINGLAIRIRAEREIPQAKAAAIKAYFLRNSSQSIPKEVLTVVLNEKSTNTPYVLGRLFSLLETVQETSAKNLNRTIKDSYFTSASTTPALIFPKLIELYMKHLKKLDKGRQVYYDRQVTELLSMIDGYPKRFTSDEKWAFILGYYQQREKRFAKKGDIA